jgi:hypothetical protein
MYACHNNDDRSDNRPENLRWDTPEENMRDQVRNGIHHSLTIERCPYGHLRVDPNLRYKKDRRIRICLACWRAWCCNGQARYKGKPVRDHRTMADEKYRKIMAGQPVI